MEATGSLSVLNTGAGDILVTFNDHDDAEADRALRMLEDMAKRGYAIMVRQEDGTYLRAVSIDKHTKSYVVIPPKVEVAAEAPTKKPARRRGRPPKVQQPIEDRKAVAVARSAGGCVPRSGAALLAEARR